MGQVDLPATWRRLGRARRALIGGVAGAVVGALIMAMVGGGSANAAGTSDLAVAQDLLRNCQLQLSAATTSGERTRANQCITIQQKVIAKLTATPAPSSPAPSTAPPTTAPPTTAPPSSSAPPPTTQPPTPTPTGVCLDALRRADRCGWPTAATTGPRSPVVLTTYTGPLPLVIPAGQIRSGLIVPGCVRLQAGASLVDSIVRPTAATLCGSYGAIDQEWPSIQQNVAIRYVEVDLHLAGSNRMGIRAITGDGFTLDHVHCWGGADCVHYGAYVTIRDSYLHTPPCQTVTTAAICDTLHIDALHSGSSSVVGAPVWVEHNTLIAEENTTPNWATSAWINGPNMLDYSGAAQTNVHGINNLFGGGGYTVYCEAHREQRNLAFPRTSVPMAEFVGNRFSDLYYPRSGYWGATTDCAPLANYSTNIWDRTGLPLGAENPRPI